MSCQIEAMNKIVFLLFLGLLSGGAAAQLYKCAHEGKITFSDQPCPAGTIGESIDFPEQESTSDRPGNETNRIDRDYERLASERRIREIDFEIEANWRKVDENNGKLSGEFSELQARAEALTYTRSNPPERIKLSKRDYLRAQQRNNALAQQDVQNRIQALAAKYRTENTLLDERMAQLYAEKAKMISESNETQSARDRRLREIDHLIEEKQGKIDENEDKKKREMDELQKKMDALGDNPLNESGRKSLYISMQAATLKYQLQNTALNRHIAHLRAEKAGLR
jgi:DNA repair exonuclease SbcCD ATPase subunit